MPRTKTAETRVIFKVLAHEISMVLPCKFDQTDDNPNGQTDWEGEMLSKEWLSKITSLAND